jgi:hypothetical protein
MCMYGSTAPRGPPAATPPNLQARPDVYEGRAGAAARAVRVLTFPPRGIELAIGARNATQTAPGLVTVQCAQQPRQAAHHFCICSRLATGSLTVTHRRHHGGSGHWSCTGVVGRKLAGLGGQTGSRSCARLRCMPDARVPCLTQLLLGVQWAAKCGEHCIDACAVRRFSCCGFSGRRSCAVSTASMHGLCAVPLLGE